MKELTLENDMCSFGRVLAPKLADRELRQWKNFEQEELNLKGN